MAGNPSQAISDLSATAAQKSEPSTKSRDILSKGISFTLYTWSFSECSARVRIAMNWKNLPYNKIEVDLSQSQQFQPWFSELIGSKNPTVPLLVIKPDGSTDNADPGMMSHNPVIMTQSLSILEFLEEIRTLNSLLSDDPFVRQQQRKLVSIMALDTHPLRTHRVGATLRTWTDAETVTDWDKTWLSKGLQQYETAIQGVAGRYSVGDEVSLADVCLVPTLWSARRYGIRIADFPTVLAVYNNLCAFEEFTSEMPESDRSLV